MLHDLDKLGCSAGGKYSMTGMAGSDWLEKLSVTGMAGSNWLAPLRHYSPCKSVLRGCSKVIVILCDIRGNTLLIWRIVFSVMK